MTVPAFQAWFKPLLRRLEDGQTHKALDLYPLLAADLGLTTEDLNEHLPSGRQLKYRNRIDWARVYFKAAGMIDSPGRGLLRITDRGRAVLDENPATLDIKYLKQFPEFLTFQSRSTDEDDSTTSDTEKTGETPDETMADAYKALSASLAVELLERVKAGTPQFFEQLVAQLMVKMGYGGFRKDAASVLGKSGDGGVDGVIKVDPLGLDLIYLQAKRWTTNVGRPTVQEFAGSLDGFGASKGVIITTSLFTAEAKDYVARISKRIILIDGPQLADYMIKHDLGVVTRETYKVKAVNNDFFEQS